MNIEEIKKWRKGPLENYLDASLNIDWLITEHDRLTAEKPLIAAQMLALDQERERVEGENAKLLNSYNLAKEEVTCWQGAYDSVSKENAKLREALESAATNLEVAGFYASAKEARAALKV